MSELTPMMSQYKEIKSQYEDYILFYRLGDFYEMFFDDAIKASKALGIALTRRNAGGGKTAPLCGVPFHAADTYLAKLVSAGYKVAICDQVEDPKEAKGIVERAVTRLITPGTVTDPDMMIETSNSYLVSISEDDFNYGMAYCDLSTGLFRLKIFDIDDSLNLLDALYLLEAKEVLISQDDLIYDKLLKFTSNVNFDITITKKNRQKSSLNFAIEKIKKFFSVNSLEGYGIDEKKPAVIESVSSLLEYLEITQKTDLPHIRKITVEHVFKHMVLDAFTVQNLELTRSMRTGERAGSLIGILDKTKTAMGARLLKQWIQAPLIDLEEIKARQKAVEYFKHEILIRNQLREMLSQIYDFERLMTKCVLGSINPRDMIALRNSFSVLPDIRNLINGELNDEKKSSIQNILEQYDDLADLCFELFSGIDDDPPASIRSSGYIRKGYSFELDELRDLITNAETKIREIEIKERERTDIKTLKVGYNKVFGYYVEVSKAQVNKVPDDYIRKQTLVNSERYILPDLKEFEDKILGAKDKTNALEFELFSEIRQKILKKSKLISEMSAKIAEIDVLVSFAEVSDKNSYCKPELDSGVEIKIHGGRHPVVESIVQRGEFVPNDTFINGSDNSCLIITGPNMAGKSTYLRQVALISLMGQIGSFVPADSAKLGIADRIFTRVGASDDLYRAQSTFMVEMLELANILNHASNRSLIILDEIGRGTATYDGLSIAWSSAEYIAEKIKARSLFATHYHEMTELENIVEGISNYRISAIERNDDIIFLRKLERGSANKSFGVQVAKLAGVPNEVIKRAKSILKKLESSDIVKSPITEKKDITEKNEEEKNNIDCSELLKAIDELDINSTTPVKALIELQKIKDLAKSIEEAN